MAFEGPLTVLANRRRFDEALTAAIGAPPAADRVHALLMLDLNRFKAINDVYGHPVGDEVLAVVSGRLAGAVRNQEDVVARLGGDEFAIIALHVYGAEEATGIGLRVIEALRAPIKVGQNEHSMGIGVGIALFPHDALNAQEWVRRADIALSRAKTERPSALKFFQDDMDEQVKARARLEAALRHALRAGEITVHYQPQRELDSGKVATFEAVAQWHHHAWGNVPPERFIPVAEECGLIHELGMQILRTACADAKSWPDTISVSVNISPMQLHMHDFQAMVERALAEADLRCAIHQSVSVSEKPRWTSSEFVRANRPGRQWLHGRFVAEGGIKPGSPACCRRCPRNGSSGTDARPAENHPQR